MKASLLWMQDYVPVNRENPAQELADKLTMAGIPVEKVVVLDKGLERIYTGQIVKIEAHPDADKLRVCTVACVEGGISVEKQIVTAATNVAEGHIVPVAYHKSRLADGTVIKKGKLRGVVSEGMFCSIAELGISKDQVLPEQGEGIYILPEDTPIGADIRDVLDLFDVVYEFELTPNRADCFSMVGLSREMAVLTDEKASLPLVEVEESEDSIEGRVSIDIADETLCHRFTARLVEGVNIGPSPLWMQNRLRAAGVRPINNVVDVTNYVMLELGQPMHAYDYDCVKGHTLTARPAKEGETIKTLDGSTRTLLPSMLVIADEEKAVGVAGVMGGYDSEVTEKTSSVLLEAAIFKGSSVRKTARALGMRSEASGRFERGVNPAYTLLAIDRAAQLLKQICPAAKVAQGVIDVYPVKRENRTISFTADQINSYLGTSISVEEMRTILEKLFFEVEVKGGGIFVARVPSWRDDVEGMADISEEIARIYGYKNIVATIQTATLDSGVLSLHKIYARKIAKNLQKSGLSEILTFSFMHHSQLEKLLLEPADERYTAVPILNPISEEFPLLRTSLIPSVLEATVRNRAKKNENLWFFETGSVYKPKSLPITELPIESMMTAGVMVGVAEDDSWLKTPRETDFYDVKGVVDSLLDALRIPSFTVERGGESYLHPGVSATYKINDIVIARFGRLHPKVAMNYDVPENTYVFEIYIDTIINQPQRVARYTPLSKFPGITRDLAIVSPKEVMHEEIIDIIYEKGGPYLENAYIFDVYEGAHIEEGFNSKAYSLAFRSKEGTLTDSDIEGYIQAIILSLGEKNCKLR